MATRTLRISFDEFQLWDQTGSARLSPSIPPLTLSQAAAGPEGGTTESVVKTVVLPDGTVVTITVSVSEAMQRLATLPRAASQPASNSVYTNLSTASGSLKLSQLAAAPAALDLDNWAASMTVGIHEDLTQASP